MGKTQHLRQRNCWFIACQCPFTANYFSLKCGKKIVDFFILQVSPLRMLRNLLISSASQTFWNIWSYLNMKLKNLQIFGIIIYLGRAVIGPPHGREGHGKGLTAVQGWFCPIEPSPALQAIIIKSKKQEPCMLKAILSKARTLHNHSNYQLSENKPKRWFSKELPWILDSAALHFVINQLI